MPVHDWTRVEWYAFHGFRVGWMTHLMTPLNNGLLPKDYYAEIEQIVYRDPKAIISDPPRPRHHIVLRQLPRHQIVARIEFVSSTDKRSLSSLTEFCERVTDDLETGVHVLVIDVFPPSRHDPYGIHEAITRRLYDVPFTPPAGKPLTLVSYRVGESVESHLEPFAVGAELPAMPLFLATDQYVPLPLEPSYQAAWKGTPYVWREVLEPPTA